MSRIVGTPLAFYDHARQNYADNVPISEPRSEAEFMVGDFGEHGGVGELGEFKIILWRFETRGELSPQLRVFSDAVGALTEFIRLGGLAWLDGCISQDDFARRLIALGLHDSSDRALEAAA